MGGCLIERFLLKNTLGFSDIKLELKGGLVVITGPSGAGKSVFINSILSLFAIKEFEGDSAEGSLLLEFPLEESGIENEDINIFRVTKNDRLRYFINAQQIPKKKLKDISSKKIKYISHKDYSDFQNDTLLFILDSFIISKESSFNALLQEYKVSFKNYSLLKKKLSDIEESEKKIEELKEFCKIQIDKIDSISPKIGEFEELMEYKKKVSKREKIKENLENLMPIFTLEEEAYRLLDSFMKDEKLFNEAFNELRDTVEEAERFLEELNDENIDKILDRIEELSSLIKRFGTIEECLKFREEKASELIKYENISFEKKQIEKEYLHSKDSVIKASKNINEYRKKYIQELTKELNKLLNELMIGDAALTLKSKELDSNGGVELVFELKNATFDRVSSGEFNRIRLSLLALRARFDSDEGVLILDEIDSNLSGEESKSVASLLKSLSKNYQIIVISHQPHLPSLASQHLLIEKNGDFSTVKELALQEERAQEIARMISGSERTKEALLFARDLLDKNRV